MSFIKYPHIERFGKVDVEGIVAGDCYIFPKIDGTNASVWFENGIHCGSRNRELSFNTDNAGFMDSIASDENIKNFLVNHKTLRLFGEWLVPHTFKGYAKYAWRKFYVFDVAIVKDDGALEFIPYNEYKPLLDEAKIEYIPAVKVIKNPSREELVHELNNNFFLVETADRPGEGIVIKNYEFKNKWGRNCFAKIVHQEFKDANLKSFGTPEGGTLKVEEEIINSYLTEALCEKTFANVKNEMPDGGRGVIPRVLETIYHELVTEEIWNMLKDFNSPTIDFKLLRALCISETKKKLPQMFL